MRVKVVATRPDVDDALRQAFEDDFNRYLEQTIAMAEREVGRDKVGIERSAGGKVTVTIKPKDGLIANGASDATLERSRGDDGSVTIVITPRDAVRDTTAPADED